MSRADIMAGKSYVSLYVKQDAFTRGLQQAKANLSSFGSDMMSLGGVRMVALSAAIATPIAFATKTFASFDDAMRTVGAVSGSTAAQLESMTEVAKELGRTTSFTAVQVANLMAELGRAGFNSDQVNAMTGAVLNLARATGTDATLSAGIMAATIRQFNLEAGDATRVADVLTMAANATFNSVESLGEALKYAGPVAAELGMSFEETAAILGTLGNVGIQGSEAGTALRRLGVISAATGEKLKEVFGISNVDATGKLKPLVKIMSEIGGAIVDLPVAERVAKMNEAFGLLGITASSVLSRTAMATDELTDKLNNAGGVAKKTSQDMDAGIGGSFRIIMSAVEGLQNAIGKALAGSVQGITETITGLIGKASEWVGKNQGVVVSLASITAAAAATGVAILSIGIAAKVAAAGVGVMAVAFGATKTAVLAVVAATKLWAVVSFAVGEAVYILSSGMAIVNTVAALSSAVAGAMSAAWASAGAVISAVWAVITAPVSLFVVAAGAVVAVLAAAAAGTAYLAVKGLDFSAAWNSATGTLSELMSVASRVGGILMDALGGGDYDIAFGAAMAGVKLALATAIDGMSELWAMFWNGAWEMAKNFFSNYLSVTGKVVSAVAQAITNPLKAASAITDALSDVMSGKTSFGIDTSGMKASANAELDRLEKELDARKAKRDAERKAKEDAAAAQAGGAGEPGQQGVGGDGAPVGGANAAQIDGEEAAKKSASAFDRETESLQQQIIALRQGEEAAERFKLAKQGLTDAEIKQVMALRAEEESLKKQQEASKRSVKMIQEFADADYQKNKLTPEEIAKNENKKNKLSLSPEDIANKEKQSIEAARQKGLIDDQTAKEATKEADIRRAEREHKERLEKFTGKDGYENGQKASTASAATYSGAGLIALGSSPGANGQIKAVQGTTKAVAEQTKQQKELHDAQLAAIKNNGLHHA